MIVTDRLKSSRPALRLGALLATIACAFAAAALSSSCAASSRSFMEEKPGDGLVPVDGGSPTPPPSCEGLVCSRDMKKVLAGCTGDVVQECGPDKGCAAGACVDPCTAAELSSGSVGCHFWTLPPDESVYGPGSCFAAMVANTWDRAVNITAAYGTTTLDLAQSVFTVEMNGTEAIYTKLEGALPPGQVAVVFLSEKRPGGLQHFSSCPDGTMGALNADPVVHGSAITKAFSITTDAPVSAYSIYPYGGASTYYPSATLLLPTSSWSRNYIAVNAWHFVTDPSVHVAGYPTLQVVATEDDTEVRIRPKVDISDGNGFKGGPAGQIKTWKLARGEALQLVQSAELTGSPIESDKPVGLFGGARCTLVPETAFAACDDLHQQIPPLSQWGNTYALVPYRSRVAEAVERLETVPYRLVGAVSGTVLSYDPARPRGAPESLAAGEVATFMSDELVVVKSQDSDHPFHASLLMTGGWFVGNNVYSTNGDPDFVNVVPADQFLDRYVFFADYTYPDTTLTLVRRKTEKGFMPVELDCAGEVQGFRPLGKSGEFDYAWVQLTKSFASTTAQCGAGRREAKSDGPFSVTVWGLGPWASYGYAGGTGSRSLTKVEVPVK